jgi:hypothetical protein
LKPSFSLGIRASIQPIYALDHEGVGTLGKTFCPVAFLPVFSGVYAWP